MDWRTLLEAVVNRDPIDYGGTEGLIQSCFFCDADYYGTRPTEHQADCAWAAARMALGMTMDITRDWEGGAHTHVLKAASPV